MWLQSMRAAAKDLTKVDLITTIKWQDLSIRWRKKARKRSISLGVNDAGVTVISALHVPQKVIEQFLVEKEKWLRRQLKKVNQAKALFPAKEFIGGEKFSLLGQDFILQIQIVEKHKERVFLSKNEMCVIAKDPQKIPSLVRKFYKSIAAKWLSERVQHLSEQTQLYPAAIRFRSQKTRWGSCTLQKKIQLNWRLVAVPLSVLDYVIVHELCHLQYMNHGPRFWQLVAQNCPDFQQSRQWLRQNHRATDFLLD